MLTVESVTSFFENPQTRSCPGTILVYRKGAGWACGVGPGWTGGTACGAVSGRSACRWKLGRGRTRSTKGCREQPGMDPATSSEKGGHHELPVDQPCGRD